MAHELHPRAYRLSEEPPIVLVRWLALVIAVSALPYLFTLRYGFVYGDDTQIVNNPAISNWGSVTQYFVTPVWQFAGNGAMTGYYRPLFYLWLRINDALFGMHPLGWHVASLCVHLLATGLVFFLLRRHFLSPRIAATGALIFGVHPVHIEPVVWVSGIAEPLAAVWMLASVLLWLRGRDTGNLKWEIGSLACYVAALLTMETAIILPVIVYAYAISGIETRRRTERTEGGQVKRALV